MCSRTGRIGRLQNLDLYTCASYLICFLIVCFVCRHLSQSQQSFFYAISLKQCKNMLIPYFSLQDLSFGPYQIPWEALRSGWGPCWRPWPPWIPSSWVAPSCRAWSIRSSSSSPSCLQDTWGREAGQRAFSGCDAAANTGWSLAMRPIPMYSTSVRSVSTWYRSHLSRGEKGKIARTGSLINLSRGVIWSWGAVGFPGPLLCGRYLDSKLPSSVIFRVLGVTPCHLDTNSLNNLIPRFFAAILHVYYVWFFPLPLAHTMCATSRSVAILAYLLTSFRIPSG